MLYTRDVLDRRTGELTRVSIGDWITVTELGAKYNLGPRQIRAILHHMGLLLPEGRQGRFRLTRHAVEQGLGLRIDKPKASRFPFDVISPLGQQLIADMWEETVRDYRASVLNDPLVVRAREALAAQVATDPGGQELTNHDKVYWLIDFDGRLTHTQIATILQVSRPLVSRYADLRARQRAYMDRLKELGTAPEI